MGLVLLGLAGMPGAARGQLRVRFRFGHDTVLQYEPVTAYLEVVNDSFETVRVTASPQADAAHLSFAVYRDRDREVKRQPGSLGLDPIRLAPGERRDLMVRDLSAAYDFGRAGRYRVRAEIGLENTAYRSDWVLIDVVRGIELTSVRRPVPGYPEVEREYALRYWARERKEHLFLAVGEPATGYSYGVFDLGPVIRVSPPRIHVDREGKVTVVHQSSRSRHIRTVFQSDRGGMQFVDRIYHEADGGSAGP